MWQDEGGFLGKILFSLKKLQGTLFVMRWAPGAWGVAYPYSSMIWERIGSLKDTLHVIGTITNSTFTFKDLSL
jgi:hypothetical protein